MFVLDSVSCANEFPSDGQAGGAQIVAQNGSSGGYFSIVGNDVKVQLAYQAAPGASIEWTQPVHVGQGNGILAAGTRGIRFANYVAGQVAVVSAGLSEPLEPPLSLTSSSVTVTPPSGGGVVTGDVVYTCATSRPGAVFANGQTLDGTNPTYTPLWTAMGSPAPQNAFAIPDLRDRVPVGAGGNTALFATEGTSAVNRHQTRHRHTVGDAGHAHSITDPGHIHAITDPQHNHTVPVGNLGGLDNFGTNSNTQTTGGPTNSSPTGISINSHTTGITGANSNTTGVTVGVSGTDPADVTPYVGLNPFIIL